ncbi:MAG: immune inhibitor A, partial [Bacteroidales bacterium]|nr:immune inhibitor A [Bacteroidales bacterium]
MRKITFLFLIFAFAISIMAQDATFYKLPDGVTPSIDGQVDDFWNSVEPFDIDKPYAFDYDVPSLYSATWQAVWDDEYVYVLVSVEDDDHCDQWCSGATEWESDRPELYLDVNIGNLDDGQGPAGYPNGHYQFSPGFVQDINEYSVCEDSWQGWPYCYAYAIDGENYIYEYSIPFSSLTDEYGYTIDPSSEPVIGFDVYVTDRDDYDSGRKRACWMQDGYGDIADEAWNNMDDAGEVQFSNDFIPYEPPPTVDVVIYSEDFEDGASDWYMDGEWEAGIPTYGPGGAYQGTNCAATDLDGTYNNSAYYQLISPVISLVAAIDPQLTFREWYYLEGCCDYISVDITTDGGINWQNIIPGKYGNGGGTWNLITRSLAAYEGENIQLRFLFTSDGSVTYAGWYIDNIEITATMLADTLPNIAIYDEGDWYDTNFVHEEYYSSLESNPLEFEIMNIGLQTLEIGTVTASGTGISVTQPTETSLEYGESTILMVTVAPTTAGAVSGTITINSNDESTPLIITIQGEAIAAPRLPIPELSFEGQVISEGNFSNPVLVVDTVYNPLTSFYEVIYFNLVNKGLKPLEVENLSMIGSGSTFQYISPNLSNYYIEYGDTVILTAYYYVSQNRRQIAAIALNYNAGGTMNVTEKYWITGSNTYEGTYLSIDGPWSWYTDSKGNDSLVIDFGYLMVGETEEIWSMFQYINWGEITIEIDVVTTNAAFGYQGEFTPNTLTLPSGKSYQEYDLLTCTASQTGVISGLLIINHNDTTQGAIDTIYLTAFAYQPEPVSEPAEFVLYKGGEMIDTNWLDLIDFGGAMIDNDQKYIWFTLKNIGASGGYVYFNSISTRFRWVNAYDIDFSGSQYIGAGDSLLFGIRFDPSSASIYRNYMGIIELSNENIYIPLQGAGLQEKALALIADQNNIYYDDQISYQVNIYDGYADTTLYSLINLSPFAFTVDSIVIEGDILIHSTNDALPKTISALESFGFTTMFDPDNPDGYH